MRFSEDGQHLDRVTSTHEDAPSLPSRTFVIVVAGHTFGLGLGALIPEGVRPMKTFIAVTLITGVIAVAALAGLLWFASAPQVRDGGNPVWPAPLASAQT
jgi:hypothetical protein